MSSRTVSLATVGRVFLKVAGSTWGSGGVTIARIREDLVEQRRALTDDDFAVSYAMARIAPGTNVLAFCAAMGWKLRGWLGAAVAVAGLSIPAAIVCVALTAAYDQWRGIFAGAMASVVGVIAAGAFLLVRPYLGRARVARTLVFLAAAFAAGQFISPVWVLLLSAAAGFLWRD